MAHYQDVLSNTEALLKTLQSSVESEETCWKEKFAKKDEEIAQLVADKKHLSSQMDQLQATLDKVKQAEEVRKEQYYSIIYFCWCVLCVWMSMFIQVVFESCLF